MVRVWKMWGLDHQPFYFRSALSGSMKFRYQWNESVLEVRRSRRGDSLDSLLSPLSSYHQPTIFAFSKPFNRPPLSAAMDSRFV